LPSSNLFPLLSPPTLTASPSYSNLRTFITLPIPGDWNL
jgi:hypothetical protein